MAVFVVGCTTKLGESFGCACTSRTYEVGEVDKYRAGAAQGDRKAIAEMREYYSIWKADDARMQGDERAASRYDRLGEGYYARLLKARDPEAMEERMEELKRFAAFDAKTDKEALDALVKAKSWAALLPPDLSTIDLEYDVPGRRMMNARVYIDREIARRSNNAARS